MKKITILLITVVLSIPLFSCSNDTNNYRKNNSVNSTINCIEPQNPYSEGSGHYAGFEWAKENGGECDGNSDSFNEGCEVYYKQLKEYNDCIANKNK
ncbi:hypothetical protein K8S19_01255 [bacterium]|nr:hypothetical protein [bacterium]